MKKEQFYYDGSNHEDTAISKLLNEYQEQKEELIIYDDNFKNYKIKDLDESYISNKIEQLLFFYENIQKSGGDGLKYSKMWIFIYNNELMRRRKNKIIKILNKCII